MNYKQAESDPCWKQLDHYLGDQYTMDGKPELWSIAYYPILENGKSGEAYDEPRCLIERPIIGGIDFREVPPRYLQKHYKK